MVAAALRSFSVDSLIFIVGKDSFEDGLAEENNGGESLENMLTTRFWSFVSSGFIVAEGILIGDILIEGLDDGCDGGLDDGIDDLVVVLIVDLVVVVGLITGELFVLEDVFLILLPSSKNVIVIKSFGKVMIFMMAMEVIIYYNILLIAKKGLERLKIHTHTKRILKLK